MKTLTKILLGVVLGLSACSTPPKTFLPTQIHQTEASFSGNLQNSGIVDFVEGKGFILDDSAVKRYKSLCVKFGEEVIGLSVEDEKNYLNKEGMVLFLSLNDKHVSK